VNTGAKSKPVVVRTCAAHWNFPGMLYDFLLRDVFLQDVVLEVPNLASGQFSCFCHPKRVMGYAFRRPRLGNPFPSVRDQSPFESTPIGQAVPSLEYL